MSDDMVLRFPDFGDVVDFSIISPNADAMMMLPGMDIKDLGLELNRRQGINFWKPGEMVQFHGFVRGVEVWIEMASAEGRMSLDGKTGYRVAFGSCPEYPELVGAHEASALIKANIPPMEYVQVTPEEWARRWESD